MIQGRRGEPGLRLYEFERCKRLFWQIDFYLPAGSALPGRLYPGDQSQPMPPTSMYWWTNMAVDEAPGVRVLAPADQAIYVDFGEQGHVFGCTHLPGLPSLNGGDGTYALNSTFANEFFFQCDGADMPWEAALDAQGRGFVEASTRRLKYRKLFCWGSHAGGRHWQEFLSQPGQAYLEIQAGLAPTQVHGLVMPARAAWDWTQVFGYRRGRPRPRPQPGLAGRLGYGRRGPEGQTARPTQLSALEQSCRARADQPAGKHPPAWLGLGRAGTAPPRRAAGCAARSRPAFVFPDETLGAEQNKWLALSSRAPCPSRTPTTCPANGWSSRNGRRCWKTASRTRPAAPGLPCCTWASCAWNCPDEAGAASAWQESIRRKPSVWAYRNLAVLRLRQKDEARGAGLLRAGLAAGRVKAVCYPALWRWNICRCWLPPASSSCGMQVYTALPAQARDADRVQILRGQIAMQLGDLDAVEQVLQREYAVVREGETCSATCGSSCRPAAWPRKPASR